MRRGQIPNAAVTPATTRIPIASSAISPASGAGSISTGPDRLNNANPATTGLPPRADAQAQACAPALLAAIVPSARFRYTVSLDEARMGEWVKALAAKKGVTPSQLALAWVLAQGEDIVPIPGTKRRKYLEENVKAVEITLSKEELDELNAIFPPNAAAGTRYSESVMSALNR